MSFLERRDEDHRRWERWAARRHGDVTVAVLDVTMPVKDGFAGARGPRTPLVGRPRLPDDA
jgi:hypothetical protein